MTIMPQIPSTRWCPTPEQLMILEEMYRSGVRTPNAPLIQQITAHLSYYGRIEGKNVFYWFQNHKARDRQKLRRRLSRQHHLLFSSAHQLHYLQEHAAAHHPMFCGFNNAATAPHLLHHQDTTQGLDLIHKLETRGREELSAATASTTTTNNNAYNYDWMMMMDMMSPSIIAPCYRPLKTLDLFPTTSTGLKDEYCSTSKSSSSTSNS